MPCPIDISHGGASLSPLSLFTLLTSITTHTQIRPLLFRQDEHEFSIDFRPSLAVFTPDEAANVTEHPSSFCHFQGANADGFRAWLSACRADRIEMTLHAPFASYKLRQGNGTFTLVSSGVEYCDLLRTHLSKRGVAPFKSDHYLPEYYKKYQHLFVRKRFVEFAMFGDYTMYALHGFDKTAAKHRMLTALHMANSYYDSLNIELRLVHMSIIDLPVFTNRDFRKPEGGLAAFRKYLKSHWDHLHYDSANLVIGSELIQHPAGIAVRGHPCAQDDVPISASWIIDADDVDLSHPLAHEVGHVLGMLHDKKVEGERQNCACPTAHCIMFPTTVDSHVQYWSSCSLADIEQLYKVEADYCLWNEPGLSAEPTTCGNGVVEPGEECDCGPMGCITHNCCDPATCKLRAGAKCAFGSCCDVTTCSILTAKQMCRDPKNTCDLPEYCDGVSVECPSDKHRPDGERCPDDNEAICYGGRCGSRTLQCQEIWGPESKSAPELCYKANKCLAETTSKPCAQEDLTCGYLYCAVRNLPSDGYIKGWWYDHGRDSNYRDLCNTMLVKYHKGFNPDYYMGMTPDGTSCGEGKICLKSKCVASPLAPPYKPLPAPPPSHSAAISPLLMVLSIIIVVTIA